VPPDQAAALFALSQPCGIGECDGFLSHSWHDDGKLKWASLQEWCEEFRRNNDRAPTLWFDKVCINQEQITAYLECIPMFLAACKTLLIFSGPTYTTRLWCCMELWVYVTMMEHDGKRVLPIIMTLGNSTQDKNFVRDMWRDFDVRHCNSYKREDKDNFLNALNRTTLGVAGLNTFLQKLAPALLL
jgi:hypothetical protein